MNQKMRFGLPGIGSGMDAAGHEGLSFFDRQFVMVILGLALFGLVMVYSATLPLPSRDQENPIWSLFRGHGLYLFVSMVAVFVVCQIPIQRLSDSAGRLFVLGLVGLLIVVLLKMIDPQKFMVDGAVRFIPIAGLTIQPVEFMKLFALIYAADYQLCGALVAFGNGGIAGSGLGTSIAKLGHLPLPHSDFIFALIGEELGFLGVLGVVFAFMFLVRRSFEIGRQAWVLDLTFAGLLAQGIAVWIGCQSLIHLWVNTGLMPTKGLTLPLISSGGSSLIATSMAIGVLLRIDIENRSLMRGYPLSSRRVDIDQRAKELGGEGSTKGTFS